MKATNDNHHYQPRLPLRLTAEPVEDIDLRALARLLLEQARRTIEVHEKQAVQGDDGEEAA